ncbi:MAG: ATP-binding protein [Gammaproteobacteria bacterium]|nr:ATP-binding protein [Gammaproteobacteria bacterium]MDH3857265.1 ATP-binding protein [Gammaproteobacteria bacterium]
MKRLGIKYQILLITLIPVFLIDLFFTYQHINGSIGQANEQLQSRGQIIARQIAGASEFNLFTGNDSQIQYLLAQTVGSNNIVLASIYDRHGNLITESVSPDFQQSDVADYYYSNQPILSQSIEHSDVFAPDIDDVRKTDILGWVHLYISRQQLKQTTGLIIADAVVFFVTILMMAVILTVIISRRITQPIFRMMAHLKLVETGQLGKTIEPIEPNEIGALQQGFNRMTHALLANRRLLNRRIQQATQQLNEAISSLETKNRELGLARDEALNADRTKSEFLANMSHEIRTPINGIKGFISLLSQSRLDQSQQRHVDIILKSTTDLTNIVNEILDFSKMESGKLQIVSEAFDLYEVIEQTRDILFINVLPKNIDLNLIIYSDTPRRVIGDKLRIKQILLNLIGNAIKFTDQGRVVIKVSLKDRRFDRVDIEIAVEDSGIGISEQDQQSLFQAFSQVESSATRRFAGTGLGLVISKNLATLMGGDISMISTPGEGSKFTLNLPLGLEDGSPEVTTSTNEDCKAMIFAADKYCLMEVRTLFDRAGVNTESHQVDNRQGSDPVLQCIRRNLAHVDLLVFDLRHLSIDLEKVVALVADNKLRVIVMDYDESGQSPVRPGNAEIVSVINTSQAIAQIVARATGKLPEQAPVERGPTVRSKNVLLVDDNPVNLKLASELIRLWGHRVVAAENGTEALQYYRKQTFDLIILDIQMPDIDGVNLLRMIRKQNPADKTPIIALTANVVNDEAGKLIEQGFDYFLGKPLDEEKFRSLLDSEPRRKLPDTIKSELEDSNPDCSLDYARSLALSADNESLLKQIFEILQRDIPDQQLQLEMALAQLDQDRLAAIVHKLHGVTCYTSLPRLKRKLLGFEQSLASSGNGSLDQSVHKLNSELSAVKREVDRYLEQMEADGVSS